jgi:hypothetical protein
MPSDNDHDERFSGFRRPEQNWFRMPSNWTDITAGITSLAELKVVEYVLKHTWGYQEYDITKRITIDEFMHGRRRKDGTRLDLGTGLTKASVIAGIKNAIEHGFLRVEVNDGDKARIKKFYRLRMAGELPQTPEEAESPPPSGVLPEEINHASPQNSEGYRIYTPDVQNLYPDVKNLYISGKESIHRTETDTLDRYQQTDTKNNNNTESAENDSVVVALQTQGISLSVARQLALSYPADYITLKQEYLKFLVAKRPHEVKKPAAWLRKAIEDDYNAPDGFVSQEDRERQALEEKRRNQEVLEAQKREREQREAEDKAREKELALRRTRLHAQYGTSPEDISFWELVRKDLSLTETGGVHALVANAELLKVEEDRVILGIPQQFQFQQLQHPGYQASLKRTFKHLARRPLGLELVLLANDTGESGSHKATTTD